MAGGLAIEICCDQTSSGWGPHCGREKKSHHFVGQWSVLRQFWWWWSICQQVCGVHGDSDAAEKLGRPDVVRLAQFLRSSRLRRIFGTQIVGIRKMKMKWMRFYTAMGSAMCTSGWWPCFIRIPIWPLRRTLLSCWNSGRRWELTSLDSWKMLRAFACTSCIPPSVRQIQRSLISWPKRSWTTWLCLTPRRTVILRTIIPRVCRGSQVFLPVCVTFSHAETTREHAGWIIFSH